MNTTTTTSSGNSVGVTGEQSLDDLPLWDMDNVQVERWIRTTNTLLPKAPTQEQSAIGSVLLRNLMSSLSIFLQESQTIKQEIEQSRRGSRKSNNEDDDEEDDEEEEEPARKRMKTGGDSNGGKSAAIINNNKVPKDKWKIFVDKTIYNDELPNTFGGIFVELSIGGIINALAGIQDGIVMNDKLDKRLSDTTDNSPIIKIPINDGESHVVVSYKQIQNFGALLKRAISIRSERDVLTTTPIRIQQMLCPDLTPHEFQSIRRRIYDTVILGQGRAGINGNNASANRLAQAGDDELSKINVVDPNIKREHDIEKYKKCKTCGNNNQSDFVLDRKNGDVVCTNCGTVAIESLMHEGSQYRKFEGEVDRNHHGDVANPLYSNARNTSTTLGGVQVTSTAGGPGWGSQSRGGRGLETILRNAHAYTELNISQFGSSERKTRIGYKDKQKTDAFIQMSHIGDALSLNEAVVQRSKEIFAGFRDDRELVQQYMGVIAACLCEAFDELTKDGKNILKEMEQKSTSPNDVNTNSANGAITDSIINKRASKRKDLHSNKIAGKGGLLLNYSTDTDKGGEDTGGKDEKLKIEKNGNGSKKTRKPERVETAVELKPAASWTLDDCRTWLFETSERIAKQWVEAKEKQKLLEKDDNKISNSDGKTKTKIPDGNREELEGKLVEHALTLCDQLENELKSKAGTNSSTQGSKRGQRVVTPRVQGMGKLGIKWQHSHERGSGGKGGVGNSGYGKHKQRQRAGTTSAATAGSNRTAGQIFILKTAKKFIDTLGGDTVSGEAFHKELRLLLDKQRERKRLQIRDEATRQRLLQMKRKPWLQARTLS